MTEKSFRMDRRTSPIWYSAVSGKSLSHKKKDKKMKICSSCQEEEVFASDNTDGLCLECYASNSSLNNYYSEIN
jgi:hypothetical protein